MTRYKWIDIAKGISIIAVCIDHLRNYLYTNKVIQPIMFFSVTLFIFLSGISNKISLDKNKSSLCNYYFKRLGWLICEYVIACIIYTYFYGGNYQNFISKILGFNITGPFYFVVIYLQLIILSPFFHTILHKIEQVHDFKHRKILKVIYLMFGGLVSILSMYMPPISEAYGGGSYFAGGTFLLVYVLDMCMANKLCYDILVWNKIWKDLVSVLTTLFLFLFFYAFYNIKINPPGILLIVYSISIAIVIKDFCAIIEGKSIKLILDNILAFVGKNTFMIFLYFILIRDLYKVVFSETSNNWFIKLGCLGAMVFIPIAISFVTRSTVKLLRKSKV